ncbi:DUF29 domain-containing protein [Conchiformibius steedae]|uniref:DUF29 domain-containing protein n=1 Tax=Conchiformibius steedae TaxID=153493 RepID=A0A3P2ABJ1_9NEIS|nr:DUF29 domain-containing protein [Conchiformibius steedae]RRD90993.1 DUF29 domain-containing protein [Conchiformibius steedae]
MNTDYHYDLAAWAAHQAELLKAGRMQDLDVANLIEEMEAMSRKEHRELLRRMSILIAHLLKWTYQPTHRGNSWRRTILDQRQEINDLIEDSPSLANHFDEMEWLQKAWQRGIQQAINETGIKTLPQQAIWTINEIREKDFFEQA